MKSQGTECITLRDDELQLLCLLLLLWKNRMRNSEGVTLHTAGGCIHTSQG